MKKIKKIIEVKRGDPVPENARWLKDMSKSVTTREEYCEDGQGSWYETVPVYATFDVFETQVEGPEQLEDFVYYNAYMGRWEIDSRGQKFLTLKHRVDI